MKTSSDPLVQLAEIRAIMERSSRFISLSGLSGVAAGVVALAGSAVVHYYLRHRYAGGTYSSYLTLLSNSSTERAALLPFLLLIGAGILLAALLGAFYFTQRRARRGGQPLWSALGRRLALSLALPLTAGAVFCLALYQQGNVRMVVPGVLIFYGLALLNASKYTLDEIRWLGLTQVVLGLACILFPGAGLLFFALGFGLFHIGYGLLMYNRYERASA